MTAHVTSLLPPEGELSHLGGPATSENLIT